MKKKPGIFIYISVCILVIAAALYAGKGRDYSSEYSLDQGRELKGNCKFVNLCE